METTPYPNYFWQTDLIRLRPLRPEDAEKKHREWMDTEARRMLESQLDLPPVSLDTFRSNLLGPVTSRATPMFAASLSTHWTANSSAGSICSSANRGMDVLVLA